PRAPFWPADPLCGQVFHPTTPDHPDRAAVRAHYRRLGSLLSFRVKGADEAATRHLADVLATTVVVRYALSFDGLATKVNHHKTVSEYFTPDERLEQNGFQRLIRLAVGVEEPSDVIACLNWMLHHGSAVPESELVAWREQRRRELRLG